MLTHKRSTNNHLIAVLNVNCYTVSASFLTIEVLTRVPVQFVALLLCSDEESQNWERPEIVVGTLWELLGIIGEAEVASPGEVHLTLAVILGVKRAEPCEMVFDCVVVGLTDVREGRAGIDECDCLVIRVRHQAVVHLDAAHGYLEVRIHLLHQHPRHV